MFLTRMAAVSLVAAVSLSAHADPVDRWAKAAGGKEKLATITSTYREATLELRGMQGTAKVWRTPDGRYRKEEQIGPFSIVEIFDGTSATLKQGDAQPRALTGPELATGEPRHGRGDQVHEDGAECAGLRGAVCVGLAERVFEPLDRTGGVRLRAVLHQSLVLQ